LRHADLTADPLKPVSGVVPPFVILAISRKNSDVALLFFVRLTASSSGFQRKRDLDG
jgi:hypothetical protein